ncbi:MAG TPA: hypothetical protein VMM60_17415 [Ilumatobacter sp.]|nr:hypothetical protein [Ilumatobacter sp.]
MRTTYNPERTSLLSGSNGPSTTGNVNSTKASPARLITATRRVRGRVPETTNNPTALLSSYAGLVTVSRRH